MKQRCGNPRAINYKNYGGRGIKVCDAWKSFEGFAADMASSFAMGLTLDRVDNDGDYEPNNCRWATRIEQATNSRWPVFVRLNGERLSIAEAARRLRIKPGRIYDPKWRRGMTQQEAIDYWAAQRSGVSA